MLTEKEKNERWGILILMAIVIFISYRIGSSFGQSELLSDINKYGELTCGPYTCELYIEGDEDLGMGSGFEISRTY